MSIVYVVADTHFGHRKTIEFRPFGTIEEHDRFIIERWNSVVREKDTVWHLGDVYLGGAKNHEILRQLKGRKHLVMGNHDHYPLEIYQMYFHKIVAGYEWHGGILTHVPIHPNQLYRYKFNIHGHMHNKRIEDPRYFCVSMEQINYIPVAIRSLVP